MDKPSQSKEESLVDGAMQGLSGQKQLSRDPPFSCHGVTTDAKLAILCLSAL